eukprot:CAMPEP_0117450986 /NCGR_PEP_ID=MMETSP0759-20121206/8764_1 /TAXON_ID=63605 /ORGANISM="Percolomonas cosmopolitus, Strain WS" /LENGTH=156 /DNA_ID=CAMNT_0005243551 /DNA_START=69 /DNA_END=539 /DNA_ORIENTATION=-
MPSIFAIATIVAFIFLVILQTVHMQKIWMMCPGDHSKDLLQIIDIKTVPALPTVGASFQVSLLGRVLGSIADGNVHTKVYFAPAGFQYPFFEGDSDLCSAFEGALECPIAPGQFSRTIKTEIPPIAPRGGPYNGTLALTTGAGQPITCIQFEFQMQ